MHSRTTRKRPIDYILPFLIMICAGVIVVLAFQLFTSMNQAEDDRDIYMFLARGNAKILPWGSGEWERAYNGTKLLRGDSLKTQTGGRLVIELFDDHFVRMDEKTELIISEINKSGGAYDINLTLREGSIWINSNDESEVPVKFSAKTDHTIIKTVSTIYEVEQEENQEVIRVIKGTIVADIMINEDGNPNKVESIQIGVGQQAVITSDDIKDYEDRKSPSVIDALSDDFRDSGFYKWNMAEDKNPTDFSIKTNVLDDSFFDNEEEEEEEGESDLAKPEITTPSTLDFTTPEESLTIRGTTSFETKKMMVDVVSAGEENTYELNLYVPGGTEWSFAVSNEAGTLNSGLNNYYFYSLDENDLKSKRSKLTVTFEGEASEGDEADEEDDEEEEEVDLDLPPLVAPTVDTYNSGTSNEDDTGEVRVVGHVTGAVEVIVDGYSLQAFEPGDTTWTYFAKESLGNLEDGENTYEVEAVASDGTTKSTQFTIIYNKPAEEEPVEEEPVEETPATEEPAT
ncbi:FecR domain-containing protein [Patescibacteria group bacterium]